MTITVIDESGGNADPARLARLAGFLLPRLRIHDDADLGITLVAESRMSELHLQWMDEPGPTDVLSFPIDELRPAAEGEDPEHGVLGDIVLCPEFAGRQAAEAGRSAADELDLLVVHGMLHLVGHDHADEEERRTMFTLQDALLGQWREVAR